MVTGRRPSEGIVNIVCEAPSPEEAALHARTLGVRVISIRAKPTISLNFRAPSRHKFPLLLFSQELGALLSAGLPLVEAIESLAEKETSPEIQSVLERIVRSLREGKTLSRSLAGVPEHFPDLFRALIAASERTGAIASALRRFVNYQTRVNIINSKLISASIYPALLLIVGGGVLIFLLGFVVPRFATIFSESGQQLPWLSTVMMSIGQTIHDHGALFLLASVCAITALVFCLRSRPMRLAIARRVKSAPLIRNKVVVYQLARLYRSLGMLLQEGIPILPALDMVRGLLDADLQHRLQGVQTQIREGNSLSIALEQAQLTTPVALRLIRAGERSGSLGMMLEHAADFHDSDTDRWIEWFSRLFEPMLMALIGGLIGIVVVLMYIPIFDLASGIR